MNEMGIRSRLRRGARRIAGAVAILLTLAPFVVRAEGDARSVTIVPACIVFDATTDSATVVVHNRGTAPVACTFGLVRMCVTAAGRVRPFAVPDRSAATVDSCLAVSPRECVLPGGASRVVRLAVRLPLGARPTGELRSHLFIREKSILAAAGDDMASGAGAAVPVVLRTGVAPPRWRDEQFRAGSNHSAPVVVILEIEPGKPASSS